MMAASGAVWREFSFLDEIDEERGPSGAGSLGFS